MKEIPLSKRGKKNKGKYVALVDDADFDWLNKHNWYALSEGHGHVYAARRDGNHSVLFMHREILNAPDGIDTDHEDLNRLNNQRYNLRLATVSQNLHNCEKRRTNTSGYKGVSFSKVARNNPWIASIAADGKKICIGYYPNPVDAAQAYNDKARELFGEFARLNTIPSEAKP